MNKITKKKMEKKSNNNKTAPQVVFSFDSTTFVKSLLDTASKRAKEVLIYRFGIGVTPVRQTLEAIGNRSGITRERVRQIEAVGLDTIRASDTFNKAQGAFKEITDYVTSLGAIVSEEELLSALGKDKKNRNRFRFLLVLNSGFFRERETQEFLARWHVDAKTAESIHSALSRLYTKLSDEDVVSEGEILDRFLDELKDVNDAYKNEEVLKRWLSLSKRIGSNPLAEWGRTSAPAIRVKGVRDYAYLAVKRNGAPMHFSKVASVIGELFTKKAHIATTHNELIKDPRFVLVGRGLYALTEWGYTPGVVRDVIRDILLKKGHLKKDDIIKYVKRSRFVKDNTILVNLNDSKYFKRMKDGTYVVV